MTYPEVAIKYGCTTAARYYSSPRGGSTVYGDLMRFALNTVPQFGSLESVQGMVTITSARRPYYV